MNDQTATRVTLTPEISIYRGILSLREWSFSEGDPDGALSWNRLRPIWTETVQTFLNREFDLGNSSASDIGRPLLAGCMDATMSLYHILHSWLGEGVICDESHTIGDHDEFEDMVEILERAFNEMFLSVSLDDYVSGL